MILSKTLLSKYLISNKIYKCNDTNVKFLEALDVENIFSDQIERWVTIET